MEISLALGGGGIKGLAHIGVIECLEDEGFKIRAIAGTSSGGMVGSVYAAGFRPDEITAVVESLEKSKLYSRQPKDGPSLMGLAGFAETLTQLLGEKTFEDLKIPFACTAVDLNTSQEVYLTNGLVVDAVLATIAVPGIFPTRIRGNMELIDGSVLDPVPVDLARSMLPMRPVVAVALNPKREEWHTLPHLNFIPPVPLPIPPPLIDGFARMRIAQAFRIFIQSIDITARMMTELRLEIDRPDVVIRPDVYKYGLFDAVSPKELIRAGYLAAKDAVPEIRKALSWSIAVRRILSQPVRNGRPKLKAPCKPKKPEDIHTRVIK